MFFKEDKRQREFKILRDIDFFKEIFEKKRLEATKTSIKITTANLNNMMVPVSGYEKYQSICTLFKILLKRNINITIVYRKLTMPFVEAAEENKIINNKNFHLIQNERNHSKMIIIDDKVVIFGSANFSGRGVGARNELKRNYELGILTDNFAIVHYCIDYFNKIVNESER